MKELQHILSTYEALQHAPVKLALATVVKVKGSTYRRPGARMLIGDDGTMIGSLSGGCLEADVAEKARLHAFDGAPQVIVYDMISDADVWGLNQGCNGIAHILLEPVNSPQSAIQFRFYHDCLHHQRAGVMATIFRVDGEIKTPVGSRVMLTEDDTVTEDVKNPFLTSALLEECRRALKTEQSTVEEFRFTSGDVEALIEFISPPIPLVIIGGGYDTIPLARLAHELGWDVTVVDHRPAFASREAFASARQVLVTRPEEFSVRVSLPDRAVVVIMTHNFSFDLEYLKLLLPLDLRYLGLLGPKQRSKLLFSKLKESGVQAAESHMQRIHTPVGLDIGAESPEEIALSILSEIRAVLSKRSGGFLKNQTGPIHS
jgi:xanthine/CO dehydrogenase XdhC/CoxF family maturation factor